MFADELVNILTPESQHGAAISKADNRDSGIAPRGVIADPSLRDLQQFCHVIQAHQADRLAGWAGHRFTSVVISLCSWSTSALGFTFLAFLPQSRQFLSARSARL